MRKIVSKLMIFGLISTLFMACSTEDAQMNLNSLNASGSVVQTEAIAANDLVGTWLLYSMTSNTAVNFNPATDQSSSFNIMDETSCFDNMYFTFRADGSVSTEQARLYFDETGQFTCNSKIYPANYAVNGDQLQVSFDFNGTIATESKTISLSQADGKEFLHVSLNKAETAAYVGDATGTVAEDITEVEMIYIKQ
ncbi:MAG TPA: lipocalin family protein [Salinimicrobium sp.]|nr:lipocalin family protein [Salinimicrobium sp.]